MAVRPSSVVRVRSVRRRASCQPTPPLTCRGPRLLGPVAARGRPTSTPTAPWRTPTPRPSSIAGRCAATARGRAHAPASPMTSSRRLRRRRRPPGDRGCLHQTDPGPRAALPPLVVPSARPRSAPAAARRAPAREHRRSPSTRPGTTPTPTSPTASADGRGRLHPARRHPVGQRPRRTRRHRLQHPRDGRTDNRTCERPADLNDSTGGTEIDGYTQPGASPNMDPIASNAVLRIAVTGGGDDVEYQASASRRQQHDPGVLDLQRPGARSGWPARTPATTSSPATSSAPTPPPPTSRFFAFSMTRSRVAISTAAKQMSIAWRRLAQILSTNVWRRGFPLRVNMAAC